MINNKNFLKKKELLMKLNSDELNKNILYLLNEARSSPEQFSLHIIDSMDREIKNLSLFFKYNSKRVLPLVLDDNLTICSKDLLTHLITIDDGSSILKYTPEEKIRNSLKERLKKINLIPIYYNHFIIIGAENSLEGLVNLFLNEDYRNKILSPEMNFIGIASGLLPSENLCIIIDIVNSLKVKHYNITPIKYRNFNYYSNNKNNYTFYKNNNIIRKNNNNYLNNNRYILNQNYSTNNIRKTETDKKFCNTKKIFNSIGFSPYIKKNIKTKYYNINRIKNNDGNDDVIDLKILKQKCINMNDKENGKILYLDSPKEYKMPISVYIDRQYRRDKDGNKYPVYTKEIQYDDGSVLIQPNVEE